MLGMTAAGSRFAHARKAPSLLLLHIHVLSVDHALVLLGLAVATVVAASTRTWRRALPWRSSRRLRCLVHLFGQLVRGLGQLLASLIHLRLVVRLQRLLGVSDRIFDVSSLG